MISQQLSLFSSLEIPTTSKAEGSRSKKRSKKPSKGGVQSVVTQKSLFSLQQLQQGTLLEVAEKLLKVIYKEQTLTSLAMKEVMNETFGGTDASGAWNWKQAYNALELTLVLWVRKHHSNVPNEPVEAIAKLKAIQAFLPTQTMRSESSVKLQQFSTPLPLAYLVAQAAQITGNDLVLEPTAGTGMLAVWPETKGAKLILNELGSERVECLKDGFPGCKVYSHDAEQIDNLLPTKLRPSVVLMNPPFTSSIVSEKRSPETTLNHVGSALERVREGGRLVTLSADWFSPNHPKWGEAITKLPGKVIFSTGVEGNAYYKHGTTIDTRLTVIDKIDHDVTPHIVDECLSLEAIAELITKKVPGRSPLAEESRSKSSVVVPITTVVKKQKSAKKDTTTVAKVSFDNIIDLEYETTEWRSEGEFLNDDGIYERYVPQSVKIKNAKSHPTKLVESAAMAAIAPPKPTYIPKLPRAIVEQGLLSDAQLESLVYAGNSHEQFLPDWFIYNAELDRLERCSEDTEGARQYRKAWFLGDGTGVGKGRQCAGIIADNWLKGRSQAVWISKSQTLLEDARRDWKALGGDPSQVIPLSKFKQGESITVSEGILFLTYATLRSSEKAGKCSRLQQIVDWFGEDSDGPVIFDESHAMANALEEQGSRGTRKASQQGIAGLKLQRILANARFVYVSATGASKLANLGYLERLGLWNSNIFPFINREDFLSQVGEGGIAALEVVARDLKAMGLYLARSVSFDGVEYEISEHELTDTQVEMYNKFAEAYRIIFENLQKALEKTGVISSFGETNSRMAKSAVYSRFYSCTQRFFSHLITSIKCPTLIKQVEADLEEGKAAVIQIISTDEALLDRRLSDIPVSQWNDINIDITPREYLFDYLINAFPIHQYQPYTDGNGNERCDLLKDDEGNPVVNQAAVRQRDALIEELAMLPPLPSALDQIINHFGYEAVAEVTGRSKRIIRVVNEESERMVVDKRSGSANIAETQSFMDDKKQILIFSQAGGTGRSYHSDRACKNKRPRVHYLLEGGWQADVAIQGLGRTNRSNQAYPPMYRVICTNIKGEKRFTSTIARRLAALGALTKGERKTGNQGLYREEDNLESAYAHRALKKLYEMLYRNTGLLDITMAEFEELSGLSLTTKDGNMKDELPPMKTFLNRVLAMKLENQEMLFTRLEMLISTEIEKAKENGTYEVGVETIRAVSFEVLKREELYKDPITGGTSYAVEIQKTDRNNILTLNDAIKISCFTGAFFARNERSNHVAVVLRTTSVVNQDGSPEQRYSIVRPSGQTKMRKSEFSNSYWYEISQEEFEVAWEQQIANEPEFTTSKFYLITGVLLPIWKRLDSRRMRIYRVVTSDGERLLGRAVTEEAMQVIAHSFNLSNRKQTVEDLYRFAMDSNKSQQLTKNLFIEKSLVRGDYRLELTGFSGQTELSWLKKLGVYSEFVKYKLRAFIPVNENTLTILSKIQESYSESDRFS